MSAPTSQGRVKTCEGCVRSKIRCSRASSAQKCDRCIRLGLDCYYRLSKARDPKKRAARIEELEDKVDRILGQLTNNPQSQSGPSTSSPSQTSQICEPSTRNPCDVIGDGLVTQDEASRLLESFREMIPCFPYVQLPKDSTIESLRSERPFLLLSILFVSSFQNVALHLALEKISTSYLGGQVLQGNGVHPLDTLQGLLVTIGGARKSHHLIRLSGYLHLAQGIINDIRLDYPAKVRMAGKRLSVMVDPDGPEKSISVQNEEMRALVGYFILDKCRSTMLQRTNKMPLTPFIQSCAAKLSHECEFPSDQYLLGQVHFQHMLGQVDDLVARGFNHTNPPLADIEGIVCTLRSQMDGYKTQFPAHFHHDIFLGADSGIFDVHLYQTVFFDVYPSASAVESVEPLVALQRIHALCQGLAAAQRCINFYFNLPLGIEKRWSYLQWITNGFGIMASCKLALAAMEPSMRDHDQVRALRESLDMRLQLQNILMRLETIDKDCKGGVLGGPETFHYHTWTRQIYDWFQNKYYLAQLDNVSQSRGPSSAPSVTPSWVPGSGVYQVPLTDDGFPWMDPPDMAIETLFPTAGHSV